jgi:hypothetical protein
MTKNDVNFCGAIKITGKNDTQMASLCLTIYMKTQSHKCGNYGGPSIVLSITNIMCEQGGSFFQKEIPKYNRRF